MLWRRADMRSLVSLMRNARGYTEVENELWFMWD